MKTLTPPMPRHLPNARQAASFQGFQGQGFRGQDFRGRGFRGRGFTMMEVLVAIAIFTVGMVAVASIFPVAVLLQRETVYSVEAKQFGRNAEALIDAIGFTDTLANWDGVENDGPLSPNPDVVSPLPENAFEGWSIEDRSYNATHDITGRTVFWVPLVYDGDSVDNAYAWRVYLFVVRGRTTNDYTKFPLPDTNWTDIQEWADVNVNPAANRDPGSNPGVPGVCRISTTIGATAGVNNRFIFDNAPRLVFPGDSVVDADGYVYTVSKATDTDITVNGVIPGILPIDIWAAHPGDGTTSSFVKLITLVEDTPGTLIREP